MHCVRMYVRTYVPKTTIGCLVGGLAGETIGGGLRCLFSKVERKELGLGNVG